MAEQVKSPRVSVAPDRKRVSTARLWVMTLLCGVMVWAALGSLATNGNGRLSSATLAQASGVVAVMAVFGLRSVPVRFVVRGMALVSGAMLARFGQLGATEGLSGSWRVLIWLAAFGVALTIAPSSRSAVVTLGSGGDIQSDDGVEPGVRAMSIGSDTRGRLPLAIAIAMVSLVTGFALLIGPRVSNWFPTGARAGDLIDNARNRGDNVLVSRESLDMTARPRLSDKVIMTVRSPIVSFWRAELFDIWDGTAWSRSYPRSGRMIDDGTVTPAADDLAAINGIETTQEFKLSGGFATVLPTAPSAVRITSAAELAQRSDGTIVTAYRAMGDGTTYTVTSRQMIIDSDALRAAGSARQPRSGETLAARVLAQYAQPPITTDRVRDIAKQVTADATNDFDRIVALQKWMSNNNSYSLDAPLSPAGVDVVDYFLFEQREGWCEQIASSLVVMARSVGIPARLATGYAPGEWDSAGRRFIVRERDAHAWAEVWFPDQGWVPFDPTANVPLAGTAEATAGAQARDWREVFGVILLVIGLVSIAASPVARLVTRVFERFRDRRAVARVVAGSWELRAAQRLERLGIAAGRARQPSESLNSYGHQLTEITHDERFATVGELIDRALYSPMNPRSAGMEATEDERRLVEELLDAMQRADRQPVGASGLS
ncbi:MAG: transglutaminase family protein [Microthrixaceae bacterium]|nr:transglutaminase family protein [Microthrixaceae bacterium]